jgi:hypothetical protein
LTIIATALIDTGSRMDDVSSEEFKAPVTAKLPDHRLSDKRLFPAIDLQRSGTRKEELVIPKDDLSRVWVCVACSIPFRRPSRWKWSRRLERPVERRFWRRCGNGAKTVLVLSSLYFDNYAQVTLCHSRSKFKTKDQNSRPRLRVCNPFI